MGHVALTAGYYLMAKCGMHRFADFSSMDTFDIDSVTVKDSIIRIGPMPHSQLFAWRDPDQIRDILVFIGEAQLPTGKYMFCKQLVEFAQQLGVERVFTFAAMATEMLPRDEGLVFCAATAKEQIPDLVSLVSLGVEGLENGQISGMNGVFLGAALEAGLSGTCLLGEIPASLLHVPFPRASIAVLDVFLKLACVSVDLTDLREQADEVDRQIAALVEQFSKPIKPSEAEQIDSEFYNEYAPAADEAALSEETVEHIDALFDEATLDRSKAYELKRELDRLEIFEQYEDRFLDLFRKPE